MPLLRWGIQSVKQTAGKTFRRCRYDLRWHTKFLVQADAVLEAIDYNKKMCSDTDRSEVVAVLIQARIRTRWIDGKRLPRKLAALYKLFVAADVYAVPQKSQLNSMKRVNGSSICVEDHQLFHVFIMSQAVNLRLVILPTWLFVRPCTSALSMLPAA